MCNGKQNIFELFYLEALITKCFQLPHWCWDEWAKLRHSSQGVSPARGVAGLRLRVHCPNITWPESDSKHVPSCPCSSELISWPGLEFVGWWKAYKGKGKTEHALDCFAAWRRHAVGTGKGMAHALLLTIQISLSCHNSAKLGERSIKSTTKNN